MADLISELQWRGLVHQSTEEGALRAHLGDGGRRLYVGFDPTSTSLTIGNLVTIMLLAHAQRCGHQPVVVSGGGTGLIGDPGGKTAERPLLSLEQVHANLTAQRPIFDALLPGADIVNNADWLTTLGYIEVLRDIGKCFSVNEMVKRDSVRSRLEGAGISYTEFSYMLLQSYDFLHLYRTRGVTVQMGGSDQWGNIVSGTELIRRLDDGEAHAITTPLLLKSDGTKFGKSESGAVWLTADRTSPYAFHQFWLNADDADVARFLRTFTHFPRPDIEAIEAEQRAHPEQRTAQRALADDLTTRLHGAEATERARRAGAALFSGDVAGLDAPTIAEAFAGVPTLTLERARLGTDGITVAVLVESGLAKSNREAREFLANGSIAVNGAKVAADHVLDATHLLHGTTALVRRGKKHWAVVRCSA